MTRRITLVPRGGGSLACFLVIAVLVSLRGATLAMAATTERINISSTGEQANTARCYSCSDGHSLVLSMSTEGRYVAFDSDASNLVPDDTNGTYDVFVRDRQTGTTTRIEGAYHPAMSGDGRFVAYSAGGREYLYERSTGTAERVDVSSSGDLGNSFIYGGLASVSGTGRYVAFASMADNLVPGDTNYRTDVFVRDRVAGTTERVSVASDGSQADAESRAAAISADGRYVVFSSFAGKLVPGGGGSPALYVHDRDLDTTARIDMSSTGEAGNAGVHDGSPAAISVDGRFVAFLSYATNLAAGAGPYDVSVYVRDLVAQTTEIESAKAPSELYASSSAPQISADGRYVAFASTSNTLVPDDFGYTDVFIRDRSTGLTERVSVNTAGEHANFHSSGDVQPALSADGSVVIFTSWASNLVRDDTNGAEDVFARIRASEYDFAGFFPPVDNPPTVNSVQAGRAVPVKFSLGGDQGRQIFAADRPESRQIDCDSSAPIDGIESTVTAGSSSLSYDPIVDQYTYVWKTSEDWAETCRQLFVRLNDGSDHLANFKFR